MKFSLRAHCGLLAVLVLTASCSTYDRVAVWYKYRNDFRAQIIKSETATGSTQRTIVAVPSTAPLHVNGLGNEVLIASTGNNSTPLASESVAVGSLLANSLAKPSFSKKGEIVSKLPTSNSEKVTIRHALQVKKALKASASPQGSGKSQMVALLLCFFIGVLGIHRFYLGYIWQGVLQLFTLGGCGLSALIDLIRIAMGDLQPYGGNYSQTLESLNN